MRDKYAQNEKLQIKILGWVKDMQTKKQDAEPLQRIVHMLQDNTLLLYNIERKKAQLNALRVRENLRKDQLRFIYQEEENLPLMQIVYNGWAYSIIMCDRCVWDSENSSSDTYLLNDEEDFDPEALRKVKGDQ